MKHSWLLKKFFSPIGKLSLIAILWLGGVYAFEAINKTNFFHHTVTTEVNADGNINVWWPTQGSRISNTQAFKAQVQDKNVSEYSMFWSVDGGQQNAMSDSSADYPHKEAVVDLHGWTWKGAGPYNVTFSAFDSNNNPLGQSSIEIYTLADAQGPTTVEAGSTATSTESTISSDVQISGVQALATQEVAISTVVSTNSIKSINAWWPTDNASVQGQQPFKASVNGVSPDDYTMFWQVDGGQYNSMQKMSDHYEAPVEVSGWTWKGTGPYKVTFIAKNSTDMVIATKDVNISIGGNATPAPTPTVLESQKVEITPVVLKNLVTKVTGSNPFAGQKLYVNPNTDAKRIANQWRASRPADAYQLDKIANAPETVWLGGWNTDISGFVKDKVKEIQGQGALPVFVAYNIPQRDCGQYSAGGVGSADEYKNWIRKIKEAVGGNKAVVIMEPDALTLTDCLGSKAGDRYALVKDAVDILKSSPNIAVYIDAGHPEWINPTEMADRLTKSGVAEADGFSLNISNFYTTQDNAEYGKQISEKIGGKHFVIDTGRNGLGPTSDKQWCNPKGIALGARPTTSTGYTLIDAFLWVKGPGGSDGTCNGGPNAGEWWPEYALEIAKRSAN